MKTHLKRIGSFLGYTLAFNIISFIFYFLPAFAAHDFYGPIFLIFGIAQICFTILFFNRFGIMFYHFICIKHYSDDMAGTNRQLAFLYLF